MKKTKEEILSQKLVEFGLDTESILYRYTSENYIISYDGNKYLKAKNESLDLVEDHYEDIGHTFISKEFGQGLSFLRKPDEEFERKDRRLVSINLGEVLDQGGVIYRISSLPEYLEGYFLTLPNGKIKIN